MTFKKPNRYRSLIYVLIMMVIGLGAPSQTQALSEASSRPKIGLALGGGGALGLAHIGVLKWLEENRIPVDFVAGTSMGGLVGGCYAMGMSPEAIETLMNQVPWDRIFNPVPPYHSLDFRRKEDRMEYPIETELGLKNGVINLPNGLPVHEIGLLLSRLTFPYSTINNFDELPIPFRCVAADIRHSEVVVLGDSSLTEAMRATMAIPGVFTPVEWRDRFLVDGGILNNLPADVVKEMGADFIIAVDLFNYDQEQEIKGLANILLNTIDTITIDNTRRSVQLADLVINPDSRGLSVVSWKAVEEFIARGYQAAAGQAHLLKPYALDEASWEAHLRQRQSKLKTTVPVMRAIEIIGASDVNREIIRIKLSKHLHRPIDLESLERDLTDLLGSGFYEGLRYGYRINDGQGPTLLITAVEKKYGPPFLNFGFSMKVDGMKADHRNFGVHFRINSFNLAGPGSELRTDIGIGTEFQLASELYKPFGENRLFIAPSLRLNQSNSSIFDGETRVTDYEVIAGGMKLDVGYNFNKCSEARLGYSFTNQNPRIKIGRALPGDYEGNLEAAHFKWTYSSADGGMLDNKGFLSQIILIHYYSGPELDSLNQGEAKFSWTSPVGKEDMVIALLEAGTSFNHTAPVLQQFCLGGPLRLGTYYTDQLRGSNYLLTSVGFLKFWRKLPMFGKVYFGTWLEQGGVFEDWSDPKLEADLTIGLLGRTVIGPVFIGGSYGKGENPFFNIVIGKIF